MRAAVYIRMSTDKQEDSPERQRATTRQAIGSAGFDFYKEYLDEALRGWDSTRPGFRQLLSDAADRKFDVIVVDECSRLSRNEPAEFVAEVMWPLKRAGVQLYSVAENGLQDWDNLPGFLLSAVYQDRSSGESKKTAWRVTSNYLNLSADGRIDLGKPPFGYKRVWLDTAENVVHEGTYPPEHVRKMKPLPHLVVGDPDKVEVVRLIFDCYANKDMSLRDIGRELERRGIRTPNGKTVWAHNCIATILKEMKYAGFYVFNRRREGKFCRLGAQGVEKAGGFHTETGKNPRDAWRLIADHHEAIIPVELFNRVQDLLASNRTRTTPAPDRGNFLLTKLLFCGSCGKPMTGHRNKPGGEASYRCSQAAGTAQNHCHNNLVKESKVLDRVAATLEEQFLDPEFIDMCVEEAERMDSEAGSEERAKSLRAELARLERQLDQAASRLLDANEHTYRLLNAKIGELSMRKKQVEGQLAETQGPSHKEMMTELLRRLEQEIRNFREALKSRDPQRIRVVLRRFVAWVDLYVERRLVGKVKHRYYLVGGEIMLAVGDRQAYSRMRRDELRAISTRQMGTENLCNAGPTACPR